MRTNLSYYIFEGLLTGFANGNLVHISALSGGGGGSTRHRASDAVNNPYMEGLKTVSTRAGHVARWPAPSRHLHNQTPCRESAPGPLRRTGSRA